MEMMEYPEKNNLNNKNPIKKVKLSKRNKSNENNKISPNEDPEFIDKMVNYLEKDENQHKKDKEKFDIITLATQRKPIKTPLILQPQKHEEPSKILPQKTEESEAKFFQTPTQNIPFVFFIGFLLRKDNNYYK